MSAAPLCAFGTRRGAHCFGTSKLLAQLFLAEWEVSSSGHPDIAARGVWVLAAFLPPIAGISVVTNVGTIVVLTTRTPRLWSIRLGLGRVGSIIGAALVVFGDDPTAHGLRALPWQSSLAYHAASGGSQ